MKRVVIESPFAGEVDQNIAYAKRCVQDCLKRGEAPFASHLFFTQEGLLDDLVPKERELGITAGFAWGEAAELSAFYIDRGISGGMRLGLEAALKSGRWVEVRSLVREVTDEDRKALGLAIPVCLCEGDCPIHKTKLRKCHICGTRTAEHSKICSAHGIPAQWNMGITEKL